MKTPEFKEQWEKDLVEAFGQLFDTYAKLTPAQKLAYHERNYQRCVELKMPKFLLEKEWKHLLKMRKKYGNKAE